VELGTLVRGFYSLSRLSFLKREGVWWWLPFGSVHDAC